MPPKYSFARAAFVFAMSVALVGCATRGTTPPGPPLAVPRDDYISGVTNFAKVTPFLWRGAQPVVDPGKKINGFESLRNAGVRTIINLRHDHDDLRLANLEGLGLKYLWIPARQWHPEIEDLVIVLKVVEDQKNWPVFVHCAEGQDRTGYAIATYRILHGMDAQRAIDEMFDFHYNPIWFGNPQFLRDIEKHKGDIIARVRMAP